MIIEKHKGVHVLRDDLLPGGTKSVILPHILDPNKHYYVYASPVYGGMQIALAAYAKAQGKQAVIFCAKRATPHPNTILAKAAGAIVYQVPYGYLSHCQAHARKFVEENNAQEVAFGADYPVATQVIAHRMHMVIDRLGGEPDTIYCAVGSGTILKGIIAGTTYSKIVGVQVGAAFNEGLPRRVAILKYHKVFEKESSIQAPFPSCRNYDLKAWEYCLKYRGAGSLLFWNVL